MQYVGIVPRLNILYIYVAGIMRYRIVSYRLYI